jgi:hypothetical protein
MLVQVNVNSPPFLDHQGAKVIDAVGMVGMRVGEEYSVEPIDFGVEKLLAQIGRGIDQCSRNTGPATALDQKRSPAAAVLGIGRIAIAPTESGTRHPA